jgi:dephospho-CoA kinase
MTTSVITPPTKTHSTKTRYDLPNYVSVFGKMRSGKDTVAKMLNSYRPYIKLAYGDELKRTYHEIFGYNGEAKDRDGYQWFGQAMRARKPDVWVRLLEQKIKKIENYNLLEGVAVTDMRQPNEYDHLKHRGFLMIKVETPDEIRIERMRAAGENVTESQLNHETESHIDGFGYDHLIINDGSVTDLRRKVNEVFRKEFDLL